MTVSFDDYKNKLSKQSIFNVSVMTNVLETDYQVFIAIVLPLNVLPNTFFLQFYMFSDYRLRMPDIKIETEGDIIVGRPFTCHLSFMNPLPKPLTRGMPASPLTHRH